MTALPHANSKADECNDRASHSGQILKIQGAVGIFLWVLIQGVNESEYCAEFPALEKAGWLRHQINIAQLLELEQTGRSMKFKDRIFLCLIYRPVRSAKDASHIF